MLKLSLCQTCLFQPVYRVSVAIVAVAIIVVTVPAWAEPESLPTFEEIDENGKEYELSGCAEAYEQGDCLDAHDYLETFGDSTDGDTYAYWVATNPKNKAMGYSSYGAHLDLYTQWRVAKSSSLISDSRCTLETPERAGGIHGRGVVAELRGMSPARFAIRAHDSHKSSNGFGTVGLNITDCQASEAIANGHGTQRKFTQGSYEKFARHYNAAFAQSNFRFLCLKNSNIPGDLSSCKAGTLAPEPSACFASESAKPIVADASLDLAMQVDANGTVHVVYKTWVAPAPFDALFYAKKAYGDDNWTIERVDVDPAHRILQIALALDHHARPHISYYDSNKRGLWYVTNRSGTWHSEVVDSPFVGTFSSIAVGTNGWIHISYIDNTDDANRSLKYARNVGGPWHLSTLEHNVGAARTSIFVDHDRFVHISYQGADHNSLRYATNAPHITNPPGFRPWRMTEIDKGDGEQEGPFSGLSFHAPLIVDQQGDVHIAYYRFLENGRVDPDHRVLRYATNRSGQWSFTDVDNQVTPGTKPAIAISPTEQVMVSYHRRNDGLSVATRLGSDDGKHAVEKHSSYEIKREVVFNTI